MRRMIATFAVSAIAAALTAAAPAAAQEWPQRTIKMVVGFGPGGGTDIVARIIAPAPTRTATRST
jgi:tripartite-type tricarboxylate transporter receptor subunit TctC